MLDTKEKRIAYIKQLMEGKKPVLEEKPSKKKSSKKKAPSKKKKSKKEEAPVEILSLDELNK